MEFNHILLNPLVETIILRVLSYLKYALQPISQWCVIYYFLTCSFKLSNLKHWHVNSNWLEDILMSNIWRQCYISVHDLHTVMTLYRTLTCLSYGLSSRHINSVWCNIDLPSNQSLLTYTSFNIIIVYKITIPHQSENGYNKCSIIHQW